MDNDLAYLGFTDSFAYLMDTWDFDQSFFMDTWDFDQSFLDEEQTAEGTASPFSPGTVEAPTVPTTPPTLQAAVQKRKIKEKQNTVTPPSLQAAVQKRKKKEKQNTGTVKRRRTKRNNVNNSVVQDVNYFKMYLSQSIDERMLKKKEQVKERVNAMFPDLDENLFDYLFSQQKHYDGIVKAIVEQFDNFV